ncbi:deoxyuridine 5'-triphosphate nucleotidohydrolase-like [Mesocricetus auratus]|uniref:Deoxyuridine 5'-triphosphate nucleotidohydrolase-like n=1 Tax=Mesocricetus auratus TaxID=10036 RepID=A0ABM2XII8_MESAU|nr:deoxyuridine 5'-triphosphate nucleotidohydrolase-like [Mesocricetus auratus]
MEDQAQEQNPETWVSSTSEGPRRTTSGSSGLDLYSTTRLVLTPRMGVQLVNTNFKGLLEPGTVGLLLGRSSTTVKGLRVHPGVIDPDYTGVVKIMVESPKWITAIFPGDRIAQLLLLPSLPDKFPAQTRERGEGGFGSTGSNLTFLALDLAQGG